MRKETTDRFRYCRVGLLSTNAVLMIAVTSLVVYFAWTFAVQGHVTEINVTDVNGGNRRGNNSHGIQSAQTQTVDSKDELYTKQLAVNTVDTNKVKIVNKRRRKKGRKHLNDIKNKNMRKSRKMKAEKTADNNSTELWKNSGKDSGNSIVKRKRKNIYGFKKRKSKRVLDRDIEIETISINSNKSDKSKGGGSNSDTRRFGISSHRSVTDKNNPKSKVGRSAWGSWAPCSVECGLGQQERVRSCGSHCQEIESKPCLIRPCEGSKMTDKWAYFEMFDLTETEHTSESGDACETWMKCSNKSIQHYLSNIAKLPSCPCFYPISLAVDEMVYDSDQKKSFAWEDASGPAERNEVYKPGARFCIRSRLPEQSITLAAQHCCYDQQLRLITRGRDAGTPNLVSPQLSRELHKKVDLLPWIICKGDWTRYNMVIQPNNYRQCTENPCIGELQHQIRQAKSY